MLLAIETSCDETALSVFDVASFLKGERDLSQLLVAELVSSQTKLHEPFGGVVPELAAREHLQNLPVLMNQILQTSPRFKSVSDLSMIAVTRGPGLNGCLLVGLSYAKALAFGLGKPILGLNHLEAHLFAAQLGPRIVEPQYPALALLVSGGHTELVLISSFRNYQVVARTRDDAVGEAFDKTAMILGLDYPGGPALSKLADAGKVGVFRFPRGMEENPEAFSFSGLKTAVQREVLKLGDTAKLEQTRDDLACAIQEALVESLVKKTRQAISKFMPKSLLLTGGVAANRLLRQSLNDLALSKGIELLMPEPRWCTDNASMLAILAARIVESQTVDYDTGYKLGSRPRWPLSEPLLTAK